jgi:uncharacterized membrane protein YccC
MRSKKISGVIGMVLGAVWFAMNMQHFDQQGYVAVGMPVFLFALGVYFYRHEDKK